MTACGNVGAGSDNTLSYNISITTDNCEKKILISELILRYW